MNLEQDINELIINGKKAGISSSFYYALNHLSEILFGKNTLEGDTLEIKSNSPTVVFKRFDELTLSEDIHNTFFLQEIEGLCDFNSMFRFLPISSKINSKLSEAVLSCFTTHFVQECDIKELEIILHSYKQNCSLFNLNTINELIEYAKEHNVFYSMIYIIEKIIEKNRIISLDDEICKDGIILYRIVSDEIESREKKKLLFDIINILLPRTKMIMYTLYKTCRYLFYTSITQVKLPTSTKYIYNKSFYGSYSLKEVIIPLSIISIKRNSFYGCYSLKEVLFEKNPNKIQNLKFKFYSRFHVINFVKFTKKELLEMAKIIAKNLLYQRMEVIQDLVDFHVKWKEKHEISSYPQYFTIGEIAATIDALRHEGRRSIYNTIMTIYGARYQKDIKRELKEELKSYKNLMDHPLNFSIPEFSGCFVNNSLLSTVKSILSSFENHRPVILTGKKGCGKTQIALWISDHYNKKIDNLNKSFYYVCTKEMNILDLIDHKLPSVTLDEKYGEIGLRDGFLTKTIKQGKCSVLENIDEAPSTVTDLLNKFLDQKYDNLRMTIKLSTDIRVSIKNSFRILATCNIDKLDQISPEFLKRFDIIALENQIDDNINDDSFKELLSLILERCFVKHEFNKINECEYDNDEKEISKEKLISIMYNVLNNERDISIISKICNAVAKFSSLFGNIKDVSEQMIVDLAFNLLKNDTLYKIPDPIKDQLLSMLKENHDNIDDYPILDCEDIKNICVKIAQENIKNNRFQRFNKDIEIIAKRIANYMKILNDLNIIHVPHWSFRDIKKLFRRIYNSHSRTKFLQFKPHHHVLFYTMASIPLNEADNILPTICNIIKTAFEEEDSFADYLAKCYNAEPKIKKVKNQGYYIMKKDCGISIKNIEISMYERNLPSLLNAVFQISLTDERELILLIGNTCFKTYLANKFLEWAQIIPINQDTTICQLLGKLRILGNSGIKIFCIDYITKIARQSFRKFDLCKKSEELKISGYIWVEFVPGLILDAILQGKSLIIKNISNLRKIFYEHFKEILSGRQNLELFEDFSNTFTPPYKKELCNFGSKFRIFATCLLNSFSELSEAVLSHFTTIFVQEYDIKELEIILHSYKQNCSLFNLNTINELIEYAKEHNVFYPMIYIIEKIIEKNRIISLDDEICKDGIILCRIVGDEIESCENKKLLFDIINILLPRTKMIMYTLYKTCRYLFYTSITQVKLPTSTKYIYNKSFYGSYSLKEVIIPLSIISIKRNSFYGCYSLKEVLFENVLSIKNDLEQYFDQKKELNRKILTIYDDDDDETKELNEFIQKEKIGENIEELRIFLRMLSKTILNHRRTKNLINKIKQILSPLITNIKESFSNIEIYNFFP